jgi:hypothetical protein
MLGVEDVEVRAEEPADESADEAETDRGKRGAAPPEAARDDADPRGDDRGGAVVRPRNGDPGGVERSVDDDRGEDVARDCRGPEDPRSGEHECCETDDRESDDRRHGGPVGDERARDELPFAAVGHTLRRRCEVAKRDDAEPVENGDDQTAAATAGTTRVESCRRNDC